MEAKTLIALLLLRSARTYEFQQGSRQPGAMCLTHSPVMEGVCRPARTCQSYQGFCQDTGNVCCVDVYKCGGVTKEKVSYFQNEEFPAQAQTGTLCSHILKVSTDVCFIKIDFHEFLLLPGPDGSCQNNWFSVIGANGGMQVVPSMCGERRGQSMMIPVQEHQNLILAVGVQTLTNNIWNIQSTMIECQDVSLDWKDNMMCKSEVSSKKDPFDQSNSVVGLREYNTSTGTILVVDEKNQDFYTWYGSRTPRKIDTVIQGNFGPNTEKRKRRKRNREKRKKKDQSAKRTLKPLLDPNIPIVRIMAGDEVLCPGLIIHQHFILTSAHCVQNMTGLYILHQNNMSIYQAYIYTEHTAHPLALVQTVTRLSYIPVCFDNQDKGSMSMLVGFKRNSKKREDVFYTNVTVNAGRSNHPTKLENIDLSKMTEGSIIMRTGGDGVTVTGLVTPGPASPRCARVPDVHDVVLVTSDILGWMSAVITQHTPVISVS